MTQNLTTVDGRSVLRMERRLAHPPERVWPALTEPPRLATWFPSEVDVELQVGGAVTFRDEGGAPALHGVVTDLDPPRLIAFTWDTDHLRFELAADGSGASLLVLTHTFDDRAGAASFAAGWHACVAALDLALDGRADADPDVDLAALHERYLGELGLLAASTRAVPQGWEVRMERQLVRQAAEVWATLGATAELRVGAQAPAVWPGAGAITEVREAELLEHEVVGGGHVRWELGPGTGHGARLVLVRTGPARAAQARTEALEQAPAHVAALLSGGPPRTDA